MDHPKGILTTGTSLLFEWRTPSQMALEAGNYGTPVTLYDLIELQIHPCCPPKLPIYDITSKNSPKQVSHEPEQTGTFPKINFVPFFSGWLHSLHFIWSVWPNGLGPQKNTPTSVAGCNCLSPLNILAVSSRCSRDAPIPVWPAEIGRRL